MNKKFKILINILIVGLFIYLYTQLDIVGMLSALTKVPISLLAALVVVQLVDLSTVNFQHMRLAKTVGYHMSFFRMLYITCFGHIFDGITPGGGVGGEAVKIMMLKRHADIPYSTGTAIILAQKTISICALAFFCLIGFIYMVATAAISIALWIKIAVITLLIGILVLVAWVFYKPAHFIVKCQRIKNEKIRETLVLFLEGIVQISSNRKECFFQIFLSLVVWGINPVRIYLMLLVTQTSANIILVFAIVFVAYATAMIPIFPGGMLGFEVSMSALLTMVGVPGDQSLFVTTLFRFMTFWFVIAFSLIYVGIYKVYMIAAGTNKPKEGKISEELKRVEKEMK